MPLLSLVGRRSNARVRCLLVLTVGVLAACGDTAGPARLALPDSVVPGVQWAGGTVTFSPFAAPGSADTVFAGTIPLEIVTRTDSALIARLPATASGEVVLHLGSPTGRVLGHVRVVGFAADDSGAVGSCGGLYATPLPWPRGSTASVLLQDRQGHFLRYLPGTGEVQLLLTGYSVCGAGVGQTVPGPTPDSTVLLLQPTTGPLEAWRLLPTPVRLRTYSFSVSRDVAQMTDSTFLITHHHFTEGYKLRGDSLVWVFGQPNNYEAPGLLLLSPRGDRLAGTFSYAPGTGIPVFDTRTAQPAYHVTQLTEAYGAAFSLSGDTLYVAGERGPVLAINATTGQELGRYSLEEGTVNGLVARGRWLLVPTVYGQPVGRLSLRVLVLDRATLRLEGRMELPAGQVCEQPCVVNPADGTDGLFLFDGMTGHHFRFDLLDTR